jgi:hypothetical protein
VNPNLIGLSFLDASGDILGLLFPATSLFGYTGGAICGPITVTGCPGNFLTKVNGPNVATPFDFAWVESGSLTTGANTPLPAALPLFATGLGALGLLGWRRKRKALAA